MVNRGKLNVFLLAACQALAMTGNIVLFTTAAIVGNILAEDKTLATLPLAIQQAATMVATIPASLFMKRVGRQAGFMTGVVIGLIGVSLGAYAIFTGQFILFCLATLLFGVFNGFVTFYRFAAADVAPEGFRSQAIAFVVAGGIIAALAGPSLATGAKDWFEREFAGGFVAIALLQIVSLALLAAVNIPAALSEQERKAKGRPLGAIVRQPVFIVAVLGSMFGYGVMALVMTATPLAMVSFSHDFAAAATVIQWHVLGMFVPSIFTGYLIARFGVLNVILSGIVLNAFCFVVNLSGTHILHFGGGLLLLGIGWNFMYVGSTTLLTEAYTPAEKAKTQATHDFLMFAFVAFATFLSGGLLNYWSWAGVNYVGALMMLVVLSATLWLRWQRSRSVVKTTV
ncbi:MFS transporter [Oscillatoria sp. FACHB-1407]|uniref:MFS transporter n=1 Tax=Oscillatoria sp. FACHB-1407 TaxID=2692847 RepID=UPI001684CF93|nr:MFS transporter [Oscillatoria sp. FACHB-1407]MBD2460783.1 MFS transporter [Oscillatoria sp. FACHB-1407]